MSKHKQPGGIWTAQYAHCAVGPHLVLLGGQCHDIRISSASSLLLKEMIK